MDKRILVRVEAIQDIIVWGLHRINRNRDNISNKREVFNDIKVETCINLIRTGINATDVS